MLTRAVRIYGKDDLRLEEFELPDITDGEIRAAVVTDSVCMSTYKLARMGQDHKRAPRDLAHNPAIIGHEMCGVVEEVGARWRGLFGPGDKFIMQTALLYEDSLVSAGFSFPYVGGSATHINIPARVMEKGFLIPYGKDAFYFGSLGEPMACIAAAFHASYHVDPLTFMHEMEIVKGGRLAMLAGAGPMGLGAVDYAMNSEYRPAFMAVTDIDAARLARAERVLSPARARELGVELVYVNTRDMADPAAELKKAAGGAFDDVFVMAPVQPVIELGGRLLGQDGCLNFFAGPTDTELSARFNFFDVHYASHHLTGTTGSRMADMLEVVGMMNAGTLNPAAMVTHIGGLDSVPDTVLRLPDIPGGKKLIYNQVDLPLTAIEDFPRKGKTDPLFAKLAEITQANQGLWCHEAEEYLLERLRRE
jgi:threonine dehydrogenase-like Zn-dependent dehydrogenase